MQILTLENKTFVMNDLPEEVEELNNEEEVNNEDE